jgi:hypothetical protein
MHHFQWFIDCRHYTGSWMDISQDRHVILHSTKITWSTALIFFKDLLLHNISGPYSKWFWWHFHIKIRSTAMLLIIDGVVYNDIKFIPRFMKIRKLVESLLERNEVTTTYEGVSKSFLTGRLERELQMVQLSATRCSCIASLWVCLVGFAAITLCVASQRVFIVVYFVIDSVRKLLNTPSYISW